VKHALTVAAITLFAHACGGSSPPRSTAGGPPPATSAGATAQPLPPVPRDEPAPTLRLSRNVMPVAYRASVRVDPAQPTFTGEVAIDVRIDQPTALIWLHGRDLEVESAAAVQGTTRVPLAAAAEGTDLLGLRADRVLSGAWTLELRYRGQQEDKASTGLFRQHDGGDWYAFTQFEAVYARRVFPSFDEPDRKTPWQLTLEVPSALTAIANTRPVREAPAADGWKRITFAPTRPLPSYLVAFAVGPFEIADAGSSRTGVPIRILAPRGKRAHAALAVEVVPRALALLEDYFDFPYPYDKLDFVPIPVTVGFGCMENPGLVTCVGDAMLFDPATQTPGDRRSIAGAAAHELAHQWFGNVVTMAWWDDIWLNEGLATWVQGRIMHAIDPRPDDGFRLADAHGAALRADRLATARAVRQPIASADDIYTVFDGVSYGKAGAVMAMVEHWLGPAVFQQGVRAYLRKHADGNAVTADFLAALAEASGRDVSGISTFLDQPGAPHLRIGLRCDRGTPPVVTVAQSRYLPPGAATPAVAATPWSIPICIAHDRGGKRGETCALIAEATAEIALDTPACPRWLMPNAGGVGHYRMTLTPELVAQATGPGWSHMTPVERVVLAGDLEQMIRAGELDVASGMALVPRLLRDGNRAAIEQAAQLAGNRRFVPEARMAAYDRWLVKTFGAEARRLGWVRKPGEALDLGRRRSSVVPLVAEAGDRALVREALRLAARWRELPRDGRTAVLRAAVRADGAVFDRLLADVRAEPDRETRGDLYSALTATRDPDRVAQVLGLLFDDTIDVREVMYVPFSFGREPERTQAEAYVREHVDALLARLPVGGTTGSMSVYAAMFTSACDPARRDEIVRFVTATFAGLTGGARDVAQRIESMDQCIAQRATLTPQLDRWLATLR